jgi:hypothetical protein
MKLGIHKNETRVRPTIPESDPVSAPIIATGPGQPGQPDHPRHPDHGHGPSSQSNGKPSRNALQSTQQECITVLKKKSGVHARRPGAGRFRIELDIIDIVQHDPVLITNDLRNWMRPLCLSCRGRTENGRGVGGVSRAAAACNMYLQPGLKKIVPSRPVYKGTRFLSPL